MIPIEIKKKSIKFKPPSLHGQMHQLNVPGAGLGNGAGNHVRRRFGADLGDDAVKERLRVPARVRCDFGKVLLLAKYPQRLPAIGVELILRQVPFGDGGRPKKKELM